MAPTFFRESKSRGISRCSSVRQPPEGPPICTALNFLPSLMPPPISKMIWRRVVPMGTSIRPVLTTLPVRAKAFVPWLRSVPMERYQAEPRRMMRGTLEKVSTLLSTVGRAHRPCSTVRGLDPGHSPVALDGGGEGGALAADKGAGPTVHMEMEAEAGAQDIVPSSPISSALAMAVFRRETASGYSART